MRKLLAFTLAETLIVMGIIGIVSALTLPNLNSSTGEKEKIAKVKKLYQNLNDAYSRALVIYGPIEEWFNSDTTGASQATRFAERLTEFMKVTKNCGLADNKGCFASNRGANYYKVILADGTSVSFEPDFSGGTIIMAIVIDIDEPSKGKNKDGEDLFYFNVDNFWNNDTSVVYPFGYSNDISPSLSTIISQKSYGAAWIINYDNMDYLKLDSAGKCPNGNAPTEQNPRCK